MVTCMRYTGFMGYMHGTIGCLKLLRMHETGLRITSSMVTYDMHRESGLKNPSITMSICNKEYWLLWYHVWNIMVTVCICIPDFFGYMHVGNKVYNGCMHETPRLP